MLNVIAMKKTPSNPPLPSPAAVASCNQEGSVTSYHPRRLRPKKRKIPPRAKFVMGCVLILVRTLSRDSPPMVRRRTIVRL